MPSDHEDGFDFWRGYLIALPTGILLWLLIIWLIKLLLF